MQDIVRKWHGKKQKKLEAAIPYYAIGRIRSNICSLRNFERKEQKRRCG
jgi:hypothetical protein